MSPVNRDSFTTAFSVWTPFISSCLIVLAGTSDTVLSKNVKNGHSAFIFNLRGKALSFPPWSMMSDTRFNMRLLC